MPASSDRPFVVTVQMLKAARREGHAWEDMRAMIMDGRMVVSGFGAFEESLVKGSGGGHKYIMKVPTGDPRNPWRYIYEDDLKQLQLDVEAPESKPRRSRGSDKPQPRRRRPETPPVEQGTLFPDNSQIELPPSAQEPPPAVVENLATAPDYLYDLKQMRHTKTGALVWHATTSDWIDRDEWVAKREIAKRHGGYYYRKGKAFVFATEDGARAFQREAGTKVPAADAGESPEELRERALESADIAPYELEGLEYLERSGGSVPTGAVLDDLVNGVTAIVKRGWASLSDGVYSLLGGGRKALETYREEAGVEAPDLSDPPEWSMEPPAPLPTVGRAEDGQIRFGEVQPGDVLVDAPPGEGRGEESVVAVKDQAGDVEVWLRASDGSTRFIRRLPESTVGIVEVVPGWDRMPESERAEAWATALREGLQPEGSLMGLLEAITALDDVAALAALYEAMKAAIAAREGTDPVAPSGRGGGPGGMSMRDVLAALEAKLAQLGFEFEVQEEPAPDLDDPVPDEAPEAAPDLSGPPAVGDVYEYGDTVQTVITVSGRNARLEDDAGRKIVVPLNVIENGEKWTKIGTAAPEPPPAPVPLPGQGDRLTITDMSHLAPSELARLASEVALPMSAPGDWVVYHVEDGVYRLHKPGTSQFLNVEANGLQALLDAGAVSSAPAVEMTVSELSADVSSRLQALPQVREMATANSFDGFLLGFRMEFRNVMGDVVDTLSDRAGGHEAWAELYEDEDAISALARDVYDSLRRPSKPEPKIRPNLGDLPDLGGKVGYTAAELLQHLEQHSEVSISDLEYAFDGSKRAHRAALKKLVTAGLIEQHGPNLYRLDRRAKPAPPTPRVKPAGYAGSVLQVELPEYAQDDGVDDPEVVRDFQVLQDHVSEDGWVRMPDSQADAESMTRALTELANGQDYVAEGEGGGGPDERRHARAAAQGLGTLAQRVMRHSQELKDAPLPDGPGLDYRDGFEAVLRQIQPFGASAGMTPGQRVKANARALEIVDNAKGRRLTDEERAEVKLYSGEGGEGVGTSMNQYYTRPGVAASMWQQLRLLGLPADAKVLEPACGTGVFLETAPAGVSVTGVEIEGKAARVSEALHPDHQVVHAAFEDVATSDPGGYDAVITNAPFGVRQDGTRRLHKKKVGTADQYFIDTSLDKVKDGGLVAVIVNKGVMTSTNGRKFRERMQARAEIVGSFRLPTQAFEHAHTTVTSDVILLRKRPEAVGQALAAGGPDLMRKVGCFDEAFAAGNWFKANPGHVLGTVEQGFRGEFVTGTSEGLAERIAGATPPGGTASPSLEEVFAAAADDPKLLRAARRGAAVDPADDVQPLGSRRRNGSRIEVLAGDPPRWQDVEDAPPIEASEDDTPDPAIDEAQGLADRLASMLLHAESNEAYAVRRIRREIVPRIKKWVEDYGIPKEHKALKDAAKADARLYQLIAAVNDDGTLSSILTRPQVAVVSGEVDQGNLAAVAEWVAARNDGWVNLADVAATWSGGDEAAARDQLLALEQFALEDGQVRHIEDYLTGDLYAKRERLQATISAAGELERPALERQLAQLERSIEDQAKSLDDVEVDLRSGWVPPDIIAAWLNERADKEARVHSWADSDFELKFEDGVYLMRSKHTRKAVEDRVRIENADRHRRGGTRPPVELDDDYGWVAEPSSRHGRGAIALTFLNRLPLYNSKEVAADYSEDFGRWLKRSEHRARAEDLYNRTFNSVRRKEHSTAPLEVETGDITLHGYQNQTIRGLAEKGKGLLAHDVGLGKTFEALALAKLRRHRGDARRQCIVVPKSVASNWQKEASRIWPDAKVLVIGETVTDRGTRADRKDEREAKLAMAAQGDYDLVIMTKPAFESVPIRPDNKDRLNNEEFYTQRKNALEGKGAKAAEKMRQTAIDQAAAREFDEQDESTYWEELRFDSLFVDEAHAYKNLYRAKQRFGTSVKFLGGGGQSKQAQDAMHKATLVRERNDGKGVYYLTATPMKNSPLEVYNMTQHIIPEVWLQRGIRNTEDFIDRYCEIELHMVCNSKLELVEAPCVVGFKNLSEIRGIWDEWVDQKTAKDVDLPIPAIDQKQHFIDMDDVQQDLYEELRKEAEAEDDDEPGKIFRVFEKMRKVAVDPSLLDSKYAGHETPKLKEVVNNITELSKDGGQIVFCDYIKTHDKLRDMLIAKGFKPEEIGIINAQKVKDSGKLLDLGERFRAGEIKVIIGNTAKMGEGVNLQDVTTDIHHVDQPWDPGSMQQREGRGVRQGNEHDTVRVHTYLSKGSFDAIRYGTLEGKRAWLESFDSGADRISNDSFGNNDLGNNAGKSKKDQADNSVVAGRMDRETMLAMLSPDPEAAFEQLRERREDQAAAIAEKKAAQASKDFEKLQRYLASLQGVTPGSKAAARLRSKAEDLRAKLKRNQHVPEPLQVALDSGKPAIVEPETGAVFYEGQALEFEGRDAPIYWSNDASSWVVEAVNPDKGEVTVRRVGSKEANSPMPISRFAKGVKPMGNYDPGAEDAAALAAAEKKGVAFWGARAWEEVPDDVVARNAGAIKQKLRDWMAAPPSNGVGKLVALSVDGKAFVTKPKTDRSSAAPKGQGLHPDVQVLLPQIPGDWAKMVEAAVEWERDLRASDRYQRSIRPPDAVAGTSEPTLKYAPSDFSSTVNEIGSALGDEWKQRLQAEVDRQLGPRPKVVDLTSRRGRRW